MEALRIITEEHQNLWRIATTLDMVADEIDDGGKIEQPFFNSVFDYIDQFMDRAHHAKEDEFLFPALRARSTEAAVILDRLQAEHRNGPENLRDLRAKLASTAGGGENNAAFTTVLRTYTQGLKSHIRSEEKDALPLAREVLNAEDWASIDRAFLDNEDPLFGGKAKAEFRELFHRIASLAPESVGLGARSAGALQPGVLSGAGDVLLSISGLESCYGRIKALKGIDLEVRQGELVALVGANGAGKTTFLRTLSGVQPMSAGRIIFNREDISGLRSDLRMRRGICQSPEGRQVFGPLSIEDNLRLGAYTQPKAQVAGDLEKIYAMFPILKEKRNLPAGTLSGGQQQMLAIGRALMANPSLILLDEPTEGLAPVIVDQLGVIFNQVAAQGTALLLIEQNMTLVTRVAKRYVAMAKGAVVAEGVVTENSLDELHEHVMV